MDGIRLSQFINNIIRKPNVGFHKKDKEKKRIHFVPSPISKSIFILQCMVLTFQEFDQYYLRYERLNRLVLINQD